MSELFLRTDDDKEIPLQKVEGAGRDGLLVIRMNTMLRDIQKCFYESELSNQFGRKVVVLDSRYGEVLTLKAGD
jgi:hypothetical protein